MKKKNSAVEKEKLTQLKRKHSANWAFVILTALVRMSPLALSKVLSSRKKSTADKASSCQKHRHYLSLFYNYD